MWGVIRKNRVEFYPYLSVLLFWFFGAAVGSLAIKNRPGIVLLGLVSLPSVALIVFAATKTYQQLAQDTLPKKKPLIPGISLKPRPGFDKKFVAIVYSILLVAVLLSTGVHHLAPQVLGVPSNTSVGSWKSPALDETTISVRLTPDEKALIMADGVVMGDNLFIGFFMDLFPLLLGWMCLVHARKHFGDWMAACFLAGSFVFTGLEESMWILIGRNLPAGTVNALGEPLFGTYWFTRGGFWFFETPVAACVGWFFLAYSCVLVASRVFPKMGLWGRAAVGGLCAMGIDLWLDPVATSPEIMSWVWAKGDIFLIFGIPHSNFVGWFLLIFLFALFWEKLPAMEEKWGRARASACFFSLLFATEMGILLFFGIWLSLLGKLFLLLGQTQTLAIPPGW